MKLSVELDKIKGDNDELRSVVNQDRMVIKKLYRMINNRSDMDIKTRNNDNDNDTENETDTIINEYNNYSNHDDKENDRMVQNSN